MTRSLEKHSRKMLITIDDYHKMADADIIAPDDRVELILGEIFCKDSVGRKHASISCRINHLFVPKLHSKSIVGVKCPIQIDNFSLPEPDACLLKPRKDFYSEKHPEPQDIFLAIEVSDTTLEFDQNIKLPIYADAGIPEYWIVDINSQQIIKHYQPEGKLYKKIEIASLNDTIFCKHFPDTPFLVKDILG